MYSKPSEQGPKINYLLTSLTCRHKFSVFRPPERLDARGLWKVLYSHMFMSLFSSLNSSGWDFKLESMYFTTRTMSYFCPSTSNSRTKSQVCNNLPTNRDQMPPFLIVLRPMSWSTHQDTRARLFPLLRCGGIKIRIVRYKNKNLFHLSFLASVTGCSHRKSNKITKLQRSIIPK